MLGKNKKEAKVSQWKQSFIVFARYTAFLALAFFLFYLLISSVVNHFSSEPQAEKSSQISPAVYYLSDDESCPYHLPKQCFNYQMDTDFLYETDEKVDVVYEEKPIEYESYEKALAATIFYQKLAELDAKDIIEFIPEKEIEDITENLPPETLDKIYEEELPNDVIVEDKEEDLIPPELLAAGYHIHKQQKNIKQMNVLPNYKPAYFGGEPVIAIVIDDMGISQKRTHDIISLNAPLTASFLTYGRSLNRQVDDAKVAGFEIMVHTPMEPHSNNDLAPDVLTTKMSTEEIRQGLNQMLDKFQDIRGINNHMGSKLTEDDERMNAVMEVLKERGLFFLDSKTSAFSVAKKVAKQNGVAYATRHVFLDNENKVDYITKQLEIAERIARRNGYAVAIGHPKTGTYLALKEWLPTLGDKKIKLVHMSEIVDVLRKSKM